MVMAVNNAALLTSPTQIDGLTDYYETGQKLRQAYDSKQHEKALNELMKISDFNERLQAASQHKYAGALVPAVQQYEEARQKAALDNLKTSADIGKTYGETGKLQAEAGKISTEAEETQLNIAKGIKNYISASAVTQNPKVFGLQIGELRKRDLITDTQTAGLLKLIVSDPTSASQVMQAMAMGNPEIAKTFMPQFKEVDGGDKLYGYSVNPFTGEASDPSLSIEKGNTPDAVLQAQVSENNNIRTTQASMYGADKSYDASTYRTDVDAQTKYAQMEWERQQEEIKSKQAKYETFGDEVYVVYGNGTARRAVDENGKPISAKKSTPTGGRALESNERAKLFELQENNNANQQTIETLNKMLELADDSQTYSGWGAGLRANIASNLGIGGQEADNTIIYDSLATGQVLEQLKSTFGGNPTEGERQILLDIQASSSKTPAQKEAILKRAIKAAENKIEQNSEMAESIRTGSYLSPHGSRVGTSNRRASGSNQSKPTKSIKGSGSVSVTKEQQAQMQAIKNKYNWPP